jgi:HlyD family secretion protein
MKKKTIIIAVVITIFIAISIAVFFFVSGKSTKQVQIETAKVIKGTISSVVTATGTVEPVKQVAVGTQVSGVVQKIYVDYNSKVKAGQLIAELDKTNLKASVAEAKANYNTALNEQNYLQKIFDRQDALYKTKAISQADYDEALYKLNNAKGAVDQKKSDLNRAETNLSYADIYSPIDGVVLSKAVDVGQTVAASFSTPTLFTIAQDLSDMQVEANVDEADIGNVKEGQRVTFTVDAYPGEEFSGTVNQMRLNATVTSNVVTYTVVIEAKNPDKKLMPGLTATISIYTIEINNVLTITLNTLSFQPDIDLMTKYNTQPKISSPAPDNEMFANNSSSNNNGNNMKTVWIKDNKGIHSQQINIGKNDGINVQVIDGLKEGDEVVYSMKTVSSKDASSATNSTSGESPFMPKPPGKKK